MLHTMSCFMELFDPGFEVKAVFILSGAANADNQEGLKDNHKQPMSVQPD